MKTARKPARAPHKPIHDLFDLLGRRWTLRLIWDLRERTLGFRALRLGSAISPTLLSRRLAELKAASLVTEEDAGYCLTPRGRDLADALSAVNGLADEWYGA